MPPEYALGTHGIAPDPDYRQPQAMYPGQVQPGPAAPYGQPPPQMYNVEDMYTAYGTMPPQQVRYPTTVRFLSLLLTPLSERLGFVRSGTIVHHGHYACERRYQGWRSY